MFRCTGEKLAKVADGFVLSSSKDCLLLVWAMGTQQCVQTITEHRSEVPSRKGLKAFR